jgi:hypothetical protein
MDHAPTVGRVLSRGLVLGGVILSLGSPALAVEPASGTAARVLPIADEAWAGSSINVVANARQSLFTHDHVQYAAFYDADRFMVLARRALGSDVWETRRSQHRGDVADAHKSISLVVDGAGFLHVAWDHHGDPLNYARSVAPGSLELGPKTSMTGRHESSVTYPQFFRLPNGDLLFLYRDGRSGRGALVLNQYSVATEEWTQTQPNLIDGEGRRSPYWGMTLDRRGVIHLAWTWRDSPDVATNHDLAYARSMDGGKTWIKSDGTPCPVPITAAVAEYALRIPRNSNLMNSPSVAVDGDGRPYVASYWSPAAGAPPRFQIVHHDGSAWRIIPGPARSATFSLSGSGTKRPPISRAVLLVEPTRPASTILLVYRDDLRNERIVAATLERSAAGRWKEVELSRSPVGAWEPSYDPAAWDRFRQIHMLVQRVAQLDGIDDSPPKVAPTRIGTLIWSPDAAHRTAPPRTPVDSVSPLPEAGVVYHNDFNDDPLGTYTVARLRADWLNPTWENGVSQGRAVIIGEPEAYEGRSLRIHYPAGSVGPQPGGAQWQLHFNRSYEELYCSYRIRFGHGFGFVKGGKLPGLAGGGANAGGHKPDGSDGWSARIMWRQRGQIVHYVYHPDQPSIYGQDYDWNVEGRHLFTPGVWQRVEHRIVMNTPGRNDGIIQGWLDGFLALDVEGLRFRDTESFAIDLFYFSTFFGGNDPTWAPRRDEHVDFDDFVIATRPITNSTP